MILKLNDDTQIDLKNMLPGSTVAKTQYVRGANITISGSCFRNKDVLRNLLTTIDLIPPSTQVTVDDTLYMVYSVSHIEVYGDTAQNVYTDTLHRWNIVLDEEP